MQKIFEKSILSNSLKQYTAIVAALEILLFFLPYDAAPGQAFPNLFFRGILDIVLLLWVVQLI